MAENVASGYYNTVGGITTSIADADADLSDINARGYSTCSYGGHVYSFTADIRKDTYRTYVYPYFDGKRIGEGWMFTYAYDPHIVYSKFYGALGVECGNNIGLFKDVSADVPAIAYPAVISWGQGLSYPTDKDLIRPGDKSAVVQLPSDLPRYGEDGATVEMPVLGLTQEDYLITGSDVLAPDKVDEDVILDAKTGTKVGESSGEITEPTTPVAGNILDWLKNILKGLLDAIIALLTAIRDGILSIPQAIAKAIAAVFTPSAEATASLQGIAAEHLPIAADLADISNRVVSTIESPSGSGGLGYTLSVDLGKHVGGGWSDTVITLLDVSWYKPYKPLVDDTIVGLAWLLFLWNLYGALPSIIHGMASGLNVTSRIDDKGGFDL